VNVVVEHQQAEPNVDSRKSNIAQYEYIESRGRIDDTSEEMVCGFSPSLTARTSSPHFSHHHPTTTTTTTTISSHTHARNTRALVS
jgi:hypothetical protein